MKRMLSILLVAMMMVSLAACGNKPKQEPSPEKEGGYQMNPELVAQNTEGKPFGGSQSVSKRFAGTPARGI